MKIELNVAELAIRLFTRLNGAAPPDGMSAEVAIAHLPPDVAEDVLNLAETACEYFNEVVAKAKEESRDV